MARFNDDVDIDRGLFGDVKALYNARNVDVDLGDDKDSSLNQVRSKLDGLFKGAGKKDKGDTGDFDGDEEIEDDSDDWEDSEEDEEGEEGEEGEGEESDDDLLSLLGDGAEALGKLVADQLFQKQFKVKIQNVRLQNLERRKRDVMVQFQVGVPAEQVQEGGLFEEEFAEEVDLDGVEVEAKEEEEEDTGKKKKKKKGRLGRKRGAEIKAVPQKIKMFATEVAEKVERGRTVKFKKKFATVWKGGYNMLPDHALAVVLVERNRFGGSNELDRVQLNLLHLAGGSIQQEVTFCERDGRHVLETYRCQFHIYFQEAFLYQIRFVDWRGANLQTADETGTSDPKLEFRIRPNKKLWYRKGGVRGRSTETEVIYNNLFPHWREAKRPLFYYGTRADLENEILHLRVIDYDRTSRNDVMGFAEVPMRGVLQGGRLSASLAMYEDASSKKTSALIPAGLVEGGLELVTEPMYNQFGDIVNRLPGTTYLAVNIIRCQNLKPGDEDGSADPYVTVTWDQTSQQTRVLRNTRNPLYEETLYFPVKLVRITKEGMEKKGEIVIFVLDYDPNGADNLGFFQLGLDQVTNSPYRRLGDLKTRVFEHEALPLAQPGIKHTVGTIHIQAYFTPDLPDEIHLSPKKEGPTELDGAFQHRERSWRAKIPQRLASRGKYLVTATDETNTVRFLPTYLCKCPPPRDVTDPMTIARMVHCVNFQNDPHQMDGPSKSIKDGVMELWSSPNYFMDVKKGASEDHAILQCNMFLGMGLDAYIAIGRLPGGIVQHVWVVTREPNGDVRFWETTKGRFYTLPARWPGLLMDGADLGTFKESETDLLPQPKDKDPNRPRRGGPKVAAGTEMDPRKLRAAQAIAQDKAERAAAENKKELEKRQRKERSLLYLDQQETWTMEGEGNPYETPRQMLTIGGDAPVPKRADGVDNTSPDGLRVKKGLKGAAAKVLLQQKASSILFEHAEHRKSASAEETLKALGGGGGGGGDGGAGAGVGGGDEAAADRSPQKGKGKKGKDKGGGLGALARQVNAASGLALPPELRLRPHEPIPVESLEVLVNAENVWANIQGYGCSTLGFDLDDEERWLPFIKPPLYEPPVPRPFYSTGRIAPKLPPQRLTALSDTLMAKLQSEYTSWRTTRSMRMRWSTRLTKVLDEGLGLLEAARCSSQKTAMIEVDKWKGRLMAATPPDHHFAGRALTFSTTDPDMIVQHIMEKYPYHEEGHRDAMFALSVQAYAHYCAVAAMWVYIGVIIPHKTAEKEKQKEEDEKEKAKEKRRADKAKDPSKP